MALTDAGIRAATRAGVRRKLFDGLGLYLLIAPPRAPGWRLKYRYRGSEKSISLGLLSDVSLKRARVKCAEARALLAEDIDPSAQRQTERSATVHTFKAVATQWLAQQRDLEPKTRARTLGRLTRWVYGKLGSRPIAEISASEVLTVLRAIEERGSIDTTHRTRAEISRIFRFAVATTRAKYDPTADLKGALPPVRSEPFAALTKPADVGALLRAVEGHKGQPVVQLALRILPYVFLRPGELRSGRWEEIDFEACEWRIPAERMKMRRPHMVPLARQVVELLEQLEVNSGAGELMFPQVQDPTRPISDNTLNAALRRLGYSSDQHVAHGFRSTASSLLNELGVAPDIIELQLAHRDSSVRAIYNRSERLEERRAMMQRWADYLDELRRGKPDGHR
jgi:integrase